MIKKRFGAFTVLAAMYLSIGIVIGSIAWLTDSTSGVGTLGAIPVIALVWPLWLYLRMVFG